jgi:AraC-like DNA-binding protein
MDVLSDVLLSVRLTGAVFFAVDARSPFVTESPSVASLSNRVLAGAEQVIGFHVVTEGTCWAETIGHSDLPVSLQAGDMVAFPGGDANVIASAPGMRGKPDPALYYRPPDRTLPFILRMNREANADRTRFVCGFLGCDTQPFNPLLAALPRIVHAPVSEESRRWVNGLLHAAVHTSRDQGAGREAMLAKLAELMFVEALRSHLEHLPKHERDWLAGVRDPQVGAALRLMHGRPNHAWTLEHLAREVGMSRSAFAQRFTDFVHLPPMRYLGRWRLQLAARMLETGTVTVGQAASAVGYQSEAAFNRAFKRELGQAPGAWRRGHEPDFAT